nr:retrovirus-related Pol polyprotein from transposon TNT 1-94 [Tanacetum cinerariifolium]
MELYIENRENGRMILNSLQNGLLVWPNVVEEDGTTRIKKYEELSVAEKLQANYDLKAINIILQGLPPDVYAIINHHKVAKEIWDRNEDLDAYDSDCDDVSNAKVVLMANLSNYGSDVILEKAQWIKPTLYAGSVTTSQHAASPVIDDEKTLILEEVSRSKMLAKQNDSMSKEKKVNTTTINYVELNRLFEDFVKIKAPKELPKVSLVNASLKKLRYHLGQFDTVVKKQITPYAITEGEWGFEHTKAIFIKEYIPFLKTLKDIFNVFDKDLFNEDLLLSVMNSTTLNGESMNLGSRDTNLYTKSLDYMLKTSLIYLLSKASKTKSWLWHRRLSHLNFGTLNKIAKDNLARGIPKLKFKKDHLCSACALGKIKKLFHQPKAEDINQEKLYLLHIDLCGSMGVESFNGKSISW